jgi:serine phosphatase RsbU (regulator of sigma subunit)
LKGLVLAFPHLRELTQRQFDDMGDGLQCHVMAQLGFEQTAETIRQACEEGLSAEAATDRILEVVEGFEGDALQVDDMTCVVLRVE